MNRLLKGMTIVVIGVAVAACVKLVWQVNYSGDGHHLVISRMLALGQDGRSVIAGSAEQASIADVGNGLFLASFDKSGKQLWEYFIPAQTPQAAIYYAGKTLAIDAENNTYFAWGDGELGEVLIYKLNSEGALVDAWSTGNSAYPWADELRLGPDNHLYLSTGLGNQVHAYSLAGELLWRQSMPTTHNPGASFDFFGDGRMLYASSERVVIYSADGATLADVSVSELAVERVVNAKIVDGQPMVVTVAPGQVELIALGEQLEVLSRTFVDSATDRVLMANSGDDVCVVTGSFSTIFAGGLSSHYQLNRYDSKAQLLATTVVPTPTENYWQFAALEADARACYMGEAINEIEGGTRSRITRYSATGRASDVVDMSGYWLGAFEIAGMDIVQVGIRGFGEGTDISVLLAKHRRY